MRKQSLRVLLAGLALTGVPVASFSFVSVGVSINIAPPELPVYVQPPCPEVGYIWTPGYWAYGDSDYYWVPGTWVAAPEPGLLWTPGYWGWAEGAYLWHGGYWGPHVGFYGGVNYGYGYGGMGYEGGYWRGRDFYYNRSVSNINNIHVTNVYNKTVINNVTVNRVSFNGGNGGINARPSAHELQAEHDRHVEFTSAQRQQEHMASTNRDLRASVNGGKPRIAATARPAVFTGRGVVAARAAGGPVHANAGAAREQAHGSAAPMHEGGPAAHANNAQLNRNDRPPGATGSAHVGQPGAIHPMPQAPNEHAMNHEPQAHTSVQSHLQGGPGSANPQGRTQGEPHAAPAPHVQNEPRAAAAPRVQNEQPARMQNEQRPAPAAHMQAGPPQGGQPQGGGPRVQPQRNTAPHGEPRGGGDPRGGGERRQQR
jgi:WXXGXW repeat (2 copies)